MIYTYTRKNKQYTLPFNPIEAGYEYIVCECPAIKFDKVEETCKKKLLIYPSKNHISMQFYNRTLHDFIHNQAESVEIHEYPKNHEEFMEIVTKYNL